MSEPATPPAIPVEPVVEPVVDSTDWKAEARKWEQRSKENKSALDELTEHHATATGQVAELTTKVSTFESERARAELVAKVAGDAGVPAAALRGSTEEELTAHAATLKELLKPSAPIVSGQAKSPSESSNDPLREFTKQLFKKD